MKVLLRDDLKHLYCGSDGAWIPDPAEARDFGTLLAAGEQARKEREADLSVIMSFENPQCELALNPVFCV